MNINIPESVNDNYFNIEDLLNGKYMNMDSDLKWPFIGKQFSNINWKTCDLPDTQTTIKVKFIIKIKYFINLYKEHKSLMKLINCISEVNIDY